MCTCVSEGWGVSLTEHSDVDTGRGTLAQDSLMDVADVVSALGHGGTGKDQAGAHVHGGEDFCLLVHLDHLVGT